MAAGKSRWKEQLRRAAKAIMVLLALCMCAWVANYLYALHACWQTIPTGDPLFDKFALAMRDRNARRLYQQPYFGIDEMESPLISYKQALAWKGEFGQDPRYWQLLSVLLEGERHRDPAHVSGPLPEHPWQPLQEAVDKGIADSETYLLLYLARLAELGRDHPEQRAELQGLLDEAEQLAPENGYVHYLKALACVNLEGTSDRDAFLMELQQAASAPKFDRPLYFPESFVRVNMARPDSFPGNKILCGAVFMYTWSTGTDTIWLRATGRGIGKELEEGKGHDLFDALVSVLVRRSQSSEFPLISALQVSSMLQQLVPQYATGLRTELTEDQRVALRGLLLHSQQLSLTNVHAVYSEQTDAYPLSPLRAALLSGAEWNLKQGVLPPEWILEPAVWEEYAAYAESEANWDLDQRPALERHLAFLTGFDYVAIRPAPEAEAEAKPTPDDVKSELPNPCLALPEFESLGH